jgi:predicted negative regulator of RcsB-dependent stress response
MRTEEEQLDAIKRWFKENGVSLIAGVAIAAAGVFGWNTWQDYQANQAEAASMRYQQLLNLAMDEQAEEAAIARARDLVVEITEEHGNTLYADLAQLLGARFAVTDGDNAAARDALQAMIDSSERDYLKGVARLRLARLQVVDGDAEMALTTLEAGIPEALDAQRADVRGNAHHALGRKEEARGAWQEAQRLSETLDQPLYGVQLKLDDLGSDEAIQ